MKDAMLLEKTEAASELPPIKDYYEWAFEQAAHIRAGRFDQIDILNVADEIESVGKSERRALASNLEVVSFICSNGSIGRRNEADLGAVRSTYIDTM